MDCAGLVSKLVIYPVKSAAGIEVQSARCTREGLQHLEETELKDRRWVVTRKTESGKIIAMSARAYPRLVVIQPQVEGKTLTLDAPGMQQIQVPIQNTTNFQGEIFQISLLIGELAEGIDCGDDVAEWLSKFLEKPGMRLMYSGQGQSLRKLHLSEYLGLKHETATADDQVAFPEVCPIHLLGQPSLDELNTRLTNPASVRNFRPNIVVSQCEAYAEDSWVKLQVGKSYIRATWPCPRCILITIDPDTGIKHPEQQPIAALKTYRMPTSPSMKVFNAPMFGCFFLTEQEGTISVGDNIKSITEASA